MFFNFQIIYNVLCIFLQHKLYIFFAALIHIVYVLIKNHVMLFVLSSMNGNYSINQEDWNFSGWNRVKSLIFAVRDEILIYFQVLESTKTQIFFPLKLVSTKFFHNAFIFGPHTSHFHQNDKTQNKNYLFNSPSCC